MVCEGTHCGRSTVMSLAHTSFIPAWLWLFSFLHPEWEQRTPGIAFVSLTVPSSWTTWANVLESFTTETKKSTEVRLLLRGTQFFIPSPERPRSSPHPSRSSLQPVQVTGNFPHLPTNLLSPVHQKPCCPFQKPFLEYKESPEASTPVKSKRPASPLYDKNKIGWNFLLHLQPKLTCCTLSLNVCQLPASVKIPFFLSNVHLQNSCSSHIVPIITFSKEKFLFMVLSQIH